MQPSFNISVLQQVCCSYYSNLHEFNLLQMQDLEQSVRQRFTSIFGEENNVPSMLNLDIIHLASEILYYGPKRATTEFGECFNRIPKGFAQQTNRHDVAPQLLKHIVKLQACSPCNQIVLTLIIGTARSSFRVPSSYWEHHCFHSSGVHGTASHIFSSTFLSTPKCMLHW